MKFCGGSIYNKTTAAMKKALYKTGFPNYNRDGQISGEKRLTLPKQGCRNTAERGFLSPTL
jgi:hypothetical protein